MDPAWENIIQHLRAELQGYGGLLQLFIEQQENLLRGDPDAVLSYANEIEASVRVTKDLRDTREQAVSAFARACGQPADASLRQLLPHFAAEVRPLIQALIDEVNHLIHRVRRGARRNQQILSRTVQLHQETLRNLRPTALVKTYSSQGQVNLIGSNPAWQATG